MIDQYFLVIEISFTVIAPGSAEDLFDIRVAALLLAHLVEFLLLERCEVVKDKRKGIVQRDIQ
jgi:hypothetical protein